MELTTVKTTIDGVNYTFVGMMRAGVLHCKKGMVLTIGANDIVTTETVKRAPREKQPIVLLDMHKWFKMSKQI